jgi:predicted porin
MKRTLALAIAAASVTTAPAALAGFPTVYGKINVSANQYDLEKIDFAAVDPATTPATHVATGATATTDELDQGAVESNASRIGIKGDYGLAPGVTAIYTLEYGTDADNGTNSNGREFSQRNIFAGIQGSWGTILAGKNDTPLKTAPTNNVLQSDIDRFNDAPLADLGSFLVGENRADNVIQYNSPILLGGLEVKLAAIQNEETGVDASGGGKVDKQDDSNFAAGKSLAISYGKAKWFVAAAIDDNVATTDTRRLIGEVVLGPVKLGALYQTAERHEKEDYIGGFSNFVGSTPTGVGAVTAPLNPLSEWDGAVSSVSGTTVTPTARYKEQDGYLVNAAWKFYGPWTLKAQVGKSTSTPANESFNEVDIDAVAVGVDYKFNDNARLYGYYASLETEGDKAISTKSVEDQTLALGLDFKF